MDSSRIPNKEQYPSVQAPAPAPAPAHVNVQRETSERHHSSENSYYASDGRSSSRTNNVTSGTAEDYHHPHATPSRKWFPSCCFCFCFLIWIIQRSWFCLTGSRPDEGECRNPNHGESKQRWETEFVDSTDAARAAAEAAERASFAARAAAELSSKERMTRQNSAESHISSASVNFRNEPSHRRDRSNVQSQSFSGDYSSPRHNVRMQNEDMDRTQQDRYDRGKEPEISHVVQPSERHYMDNSRKSGSFGKTGREKQPSEDDQIDLNVGYLEDIHLRKQLSRASSHSHSSNYSDEHVIDSDYIKSPKAVEENIFATEYDHQSQSSFKDKDFDDHGHDDDAAGTFHDYSSFFDKPKFDAEEDEYDHGVGFSLLGSNAPNLTSTPAASWSFKSDHSKSHGNHSSSSQVFQERPSSPLFDDVPTSPPASYHEPDRHAKFDNYDQNSESEDDQPRHRGKVDETVNLTSHRSQKFEVSDPGGREFFPLETDERRDESKTRDESDSEADAQTSLSFKPLVGGFRNKKTLPPYRMSLARNEAPSKSGKEHKGTDDAGKSVSTPRSSRKASISEKRPSSTPPQPSSSDDDDSEIQLRSRRRETKPQTSYLHSRFSHDDSEEELPARAFARSQEKTHTPTTRVRDQNRSTFKIPASTSYEDDEEEVERVSAKPARTAGISLRTKGQVKANEKRSFPVTPTITNQESRDQPSPKSTSGQKTVPVPQTVKSPDPETPSRASHVHPNLPDCDDIFARLGALRTPNRR